MYHVIERLYFGIQCTGIALFWILEIILNQKVVWKPEDLLNNIHHTKSRDLPLTEGGGKSVNAAPSISTAIDKLSSRGALAECPSFKDLIPLSQ
jgi:hypothetical protein